MIGIKMNVFLSGAIEGVHGFAEEWRTQAEAELTKAGYKVTTPFLLKLEKGFDDPNEIVHRNQALQKQCDLLLVEYTIPHRAYIGTDYELTYAHTLHQPTVVWAHEMYRNRVYLRYLSTVILPSLQECLDYIQAYYPSE